MPSAVVLAPAVERAVLAVEPVRLAVEPVRLAVGRVPPAALPALLHDKPVERPGLPASLRRWS